MRLYNFSSLSRNQQSVSYYSDVLNSSDPILQKHPNYRGRHYPHMLVDDLTHGVFPYVLKRDYTVKLETDHSSLKEIISFALNTRYHYVGRSIKEAVRSFFEGVIQSLGYYGECIYEIVELLNPNTSQVEAITFSFIQPLTVFEKNGKWVQYIPVEVARERGIEQNIPLLKERLLVFNFPEKYQQNWMTRIESLANVSEIVSPFGLPSLQNDPNKVPFDFLEHNKLREQIVAKLTSDIGWNMRKYPHDGMTEYYWFHRLLLFEKFKTELREYLLSTLNEGLIRVGQKLGMYGQIKVEGLPTVEEVEQAQLDLKRGNCTPKEILDQWQ